MRRTLINPLAEKAAPIKLKNISNLEKLTLLRQGMEQGAEVILSPKVTAANNYAYFWVSLKGTKGTYEFSLYTNDEIEEYIKSLLKGENPEGSVADTHSRMIQETECEWESIVKDTYSKFAVSVDKIQTELPNGTKGEIDRFTFAKGKILFPMKSVISLRDIL